MKWKLNGNLSPSVALRFSSPPPPGPPPHAAGRAPLACSGSAAAAPPCAAPTATEVTLEVCGLPSSAPPPPTSPDTLGLTQRKWGGFGWCCGVNLALSLYLLFLRKFAPPQYFEHKGFDSVAQNTVPKLNPGRPQQGRPGQSMKFSSQFLARDHLFFGKDHHLFGARITCFREILEAHNGNFGIELAFDSS